jgi:hypothetical protein
MEMTKLRKTLFLMIVFLTLFTVIGLNPKENIKSSIISSDSFSSFQGTKHTKDTMIANDDFGDQQLFWLLMPDWMQIRATLLAEGSYCYIYMANETIELLGESESITKCEAIRDAFDVDVYLNAIALAGHPNGILGDIDGDPKVTIFLAPLVRHMGSAYLGYYHFGNDLIDDPYTNLREMVYCDSERSVYDTICTIIHEFNHLIWFNNDWDDSEFLSEGLANYAIEFTGYDDWVLDAVTNAFTFHPEISLLYFNREYGALWDASYGQAYLFVTYLASRFGLDFTKSLVSIPENAAASIDIALDSIGSNLSFNDVYLDWITACVLDDSSFADGIYGFETVDYKIQNISPLLYDFPFKKMHYYYGFNVKRNNVPRDKFTFVIDNPYPYALGVSIILENSSCIRVDQKIYHEKSDEIMIYIEDETLNDVTIITSLISHNTPEEYGIVMSLDELPARELNYNIYEGNLIDTGSVKGYFVTLLSIPLIFYIRKIKKKMKAHS